MSIETNKYYQLYLDKVTQLAQTIVIKSDDTAAAMNLYIKGTYGDDYVDESNPETWRYYKHLAGEYHQVDQPMYVTSMDTLEKILFSKENLAIHRATAKAYAFGTRHYQELVSQYPKQEMLILGILYPSDRSVAIVAKDGQILTYPKELVEVNEYSLIERLQTWLYGFKLRWHNPQYGISDNLYVPTMLGIMYLNLIPAILNFRLESCLTNEAHSYHVRQYLLSHGIKDENIDYLTTKQALWLYRNINYILRNAGKNETFDWLVEHIMTERSLPLAEYTMRHDTTDQLANIYPEVLFRRKELNLGFSYDNKSTLSVDEMLTKEADLARNNATYQEEAAEEINLLMRNSTSSVLLTKALESSMVDYTDSTPYKLSDVLLHHWLMMSEAGLYNSVVGFNDPVTGERVALTSKDAYCFMWYCFGQSIGIPMEEFPTVLAKRVSRHPMPTVDEIRKVTNHRYVSREMAQTVRDMQVALEPVISIEAFYLQCLGIYRAANQQRRYVAGQNHKDTRAYVMNMVEQLYSDNTYQLGDGEVNYSRWLTDRNISVDGWSRDNFDAAYREIVNEATGMTLNTGTSIKDLQAAMVGILSQLSSYSVQFMVKINRSTIRMMDWGAVRVGDSHASIADRRGVPIEGAEPVALRDRFKSSIEFKIDPDETTYHLHGSMNSTLRYPIPVMINRAPRSLRFYHYLNVQRVKPRLVTPLSANSEGIIPVPGIDIYLGLSETQRCSLRDIYGNVVYTDGV